MTPVLFVALALAGGVGAACRLLVDGLVRGARRRVFPLGTVLINVSGSLLLGLVTGLVIAGALPEPWRLVAGSGFLGGYTTFSTASFETVRLLQEGERIRAAVNGLGVLVVATAAAGLGLWIGSLA